MAASDVENAHNERPKINTCWCIQIKEPYLFGYLLVMAIYPSCRNKLTLVKRNPRLKERLELKMRIIMPGVQRDIKRKPVTY